MITKQQAVSSLQDMFPTIQQAVIISVLNANGNNLDRTVAVLLDFNRPQAHTNMPAHVSVPSTHVMAEIKNPAAVSHAFPSRVAAGYHAAGAQVTEITSTLPPDFLQPPSFFQRPSLSKRQEREDAILAEMLQNESFMRDLAARPEFYQNRTSRPARPVGPSHGSEGSRPTQRSQQGPSQTFMQAPSAAQSSSQLSSQSSQSSQVSQLPQARLQASQETSTPPASSSSSSSSFSEKFGMLGAAARRKLQLMVGRFSKNSKPQDSTYHSLPMLDDDETRNPFTIGDDGDPDEDSFDHRKDAESTAPKSGKGEVIEMREMPSRATISPAPDL